ncbi:pirin family protein [Bacteroides sedimenti]|uniref:Pirin family protein n=1 Tax=Bacteroides sedimenti TaxID=2136147 RepID=A0ABM8IGI5_9BACE
MNNSRKVVKIVTGTQTYDGAGVKLVRVLGGNNVYDFDPFLMLDAFDSTNPEDYTAGFPWHPHRGIETITYLVQGDIEHGDSLGNKGRILDGDCQWMTSGSGIIHQEMPKASDRMLGVQLWLNLPAANKMTTPKYNGIVKADIPVIEEEGARIHIISGKYKETPGAFEGEYIKPTYLDVELEPNTKWMVDTPTDETSFAYIFQGDASFGPEGESTNIPYRRAVLFENGDSLEVTAGSKGIRFILLWGKPLKEPIAWGGPIVMNTREELELAFDELDNDTFIK